VIHPCHVLDIIHIHSRKTLHARRLRAPRYLPT
jgi:hypothetical protein